MQSFTEKYLKNPKSSKRRLAAAAAVMSVVLAAEPCISAVSAEETVESAQDGQSDLTLDPSSGQTSGEYSDQSGYGASTSGEDGFAADPSADPGEGSSAEGTDSGSAGPDTGDSDGGNPEASSGDSAGAENMEEETEEIILIEETEVTEEAEVVFSPLDQSKTAAAAATLASISGGSTLQTWNYNGSLSDSTLSKIQSAIDGFGSYPVSFTMVDINTGSALTYDPTREIYSASSIKGPYILSLLSSGASYNDDMYNAIKVSDNDAYVRTRNKYGSSIFASWLADCGASGTDATQNYVSTSSLDLARMWTYAWNFFTMDTANAAWARSTFQGTLNSGISNALAGSYTVYSKSGWNYVSDYKQVYNCAGIVSDGSHPYILAIMSKEYAEYGIAPTETLAAALDQAHREMIGLYSPEETQETGDAETATGTTYKITASVLNVRSGPGTSYSIIGSLNNGDTVSVYETSSGWGRINYKGSTGWVSMQYCSKVATTAATTVATTTEKATVTTTEKAVTTTTAQATATTEKTTTATTEKAAATTTEKTTTATTEKAAAATTQASTTATGTSYKVTASSLTVRSGPSTSYTALGYLANGKVVTVLATNGSWGKILYSGKYGWIHLGYCVKVNTATATVTEATTVSTTASTNGTTTAATSAAATSSAKYKVTASTLTIRKGNSTSYSAIGYLSRGTLVVVTQVSSNNWGKITYNGLTGWISLAYCVKQ